MHTYYWVYNRCFDTLEEAQEYCRENDFYDIEEVVIDGEKVVYSELK